MSDVLVERLDRIIEAQRQIVAGIEIDLKAAKTRLDDLRRDKDALIRVYNIAENVENLERDLGITDDKPNESGESET